MVNSDMIPVCEHEWAEITDADGIILVYICQKCHIKHSGELFGKQFRYTDINPETFAEAIKRSSADLASLAQAIGKTMGEALDNTITAAQNFNRACEELRKGNENDA